MGFDIPRLAHLRFLVRRPLNHNGQQVFPARFQQLRHITGKTGKHTLMFRYQHIIDVHQTLIVHALQHQPQMTARHGFRQEKGLPIYPGPLGNPFQQQAVFLKKGVGNLSVPVQIPGNTGRYRTGLPPAYIPGFPAVSITPHPVLPQKLLHFPVVSAEQQSFHILTPFPDAPAYHREQSLLRSTAMS